MHKLVEARRQVTQSICHSVLAQHTASPHFEDLFILLPRAYVYETLKEQVLNVNIRWKAYE